MEDHAQKPQRFGPVDLLAERRNRLRTQRVARCCEINQVARVRDDRKDARLLRRVPERSNFFAWQWPGAPLARVLAEDLKCLALVKLRAGNGEGQATRN